MTRIPALRLARTLVATGLVLATGLLSAVAAGSSAGAATVTPVTVTVGRTMHAVSGTNVPRATGYLVLYTPARGVRTGTNRYGTEVAVVNGKVSKKESGIGNMAIPRGGYVLSGHGTSGLWLKSSAAVGMAVTRSDVSSTTPTPTPDSYRAALATVPGLTHYYPLNAANQARDVVGGLHGSVKGTGVTFAPSGASFTGKGYVELPDNDAFSVATKGGMTILADVTIGSWKGAGASEYVHWMGKGVSGAHEWTFRHYVDGGTGEASQRQGRVSFYHFNPQGGLGAGSYFQDAEETTERVIAATADTKQVQMYRDGRLRDTDLLSGYSIAPRNTTTPVRIGSRGDNTGFLVGKVRRVAFFNRVLTPTEIARLSTAAKQ